MKSFKKFFAMFLLLLLAIGTMTACGEDDDDDDEKEEALSYKKLKGEWSGETVMGMIEFCEGGKHDGALELATVLKEVNREPKLCFEMTLDFTSKDTLELSMSMKADLKDCLMEIVADEDMALKLICKITNTEEAEMRAQIAASGKPLKEYVDRLAEQFSGLEDNLSMQRSEEYEYTLNGNKIVIEDKKDKYYFRYKDNKKGIVMVVTDESDESALVRTFAQDILMTK